MNKSAQSGHGSSNMHGAGPSSMPYGFPLNSPPKDTYPQLLNGAVAY